MGSISSKISVSFSHFIISESPSTYCLRFYVSIYPNIHCIHSKPRLNLGLSLIMISFFYVHHGPFVKILLYSCHVILVTHVFRYFTLYSYYFLNSHFLLYKQILCQDKGDRLLFKGGEKERSYIQIPMKSWPETLEPLIVTDMLVGVKE